jgi:hypothetical protein
MEAGITQDDHLFFDLPNEPLTRVVRDIGGGTRPPDDQAVWVQEQTEFPADHPAMIREALAADLLGAAACTYGMDQRDPVGVNDAEYGRNRQEGLRPGLMGREETKQPCALGEAGEQHPIIARHPALEGTMADPFERMEEPQGDHRTGAEVCSRVCGDVEQMVSDLAKSGDDKIDRRHRLLRG